MPTVGDTVLGANALSPWKSVRGKGDVGHHRSEKVSQGEMLLISLIMIGVIVGGSVLLALIFRYL